MELAEITRVSGPKGRRGHSSVLAVVAIPSLILMTWMGVQIGLAMRAAGQAQVAADAAALAAAARCADGFEAANDDAVAAALGCPGPNGPVSIAVVDAPGGGGDVEYGRWDATARTFTPDPDGGSAVRVTVRFAADNPNGTAPLLDWPIFQEAHGGTPPSFVRRSIAVYNPPTHITSLLLDGAGAGALDVDGSATVRGRGGISVASPDVAAVVVRGEVRQGATLAVSVLRMAGGIDELSRDAVAGPVEEGAVIPQDPMAAVTLPVIDGSASDSVTNAGGGVLRLAPGAHGDLAVVAGTVILEAGIHQFNQSFTLSGDALLVLENAAIELAPTASLSISGSAGISGTPLATGDWQGFWLLQRGGASNWLFAGSASADVEGGVYGPDAAVTISDESSVAISRAVLGTLRAADTAVLTLDDRLAALDLPVVPGRARLVR